MAFPPFLSSLRGIEDTVRSTAREALTVRSQSHLGQGVAGPTNTKHLALG